MSGEGLLPADGGASRRSSPAFAVVSRVPAADAGAGDVAPARSGDLSALADRCEKATGRDRTLEQDIHDAILGTDYIENPHQTDGSRIPPYTTSLDAAMTLVTADIHMLDLTISWEPADKAAWPAASARWYPPHKSGHEWHARVCGGRTPALALCAAALRARAAIARGGS